MADSRYYFVQDVMAMMEFKERKAYEIISKFNKELSAMGIETFPGRIPKNYFHYRTDIDITEIAKRGKPVRKAL